MSGRLCSRRTWRRLAAGRSLIECRRLRCHWPGVKIARNQAAAGTVARLMFVAV